MLTDREKEQLVTDMFIGSRLNIEKSTEHCKKHPERVFYTIIGFCAVNQPKNPDLWLIAEGMAQKYIEMAYMIERERFKDYKLPKDKQGNDYAITKPFAWFGSDWTKIENGCVKINEDTKDKFELWMKIIERKENRKPLEYRIKPEYLDDAVEILRQVRIKNRS